MITYLMIKRALQFPLMAVGFCGVAVFVLLYLLLELAYRGTSAARQTYREWVDEWNGYWTNKEWWD